MADPIQVTEDLTRKVAHLARLELSDEEVKTFTPQLNEILEYVGKLQQVDVKNIAPMVHPFDLSTPMRADEARPSPVNAEGKPRMLDPAPEVVQDGYRVPPIL